MPRTSGGSLETAGQFLNNGAVGAVVKEALQMVFRRFAVLIGLSAFLVLSVAEAWAEDAAVCFGTADRVVEGGPITEEEKRAGHEACQRALAETSSIVQKYHLQEADPDIVGRPPKPAN